MQEPDRSLSPVAAARMAAMLPDLLSAVRWRRRRRVALRAGVAVTLLTAALFAASRWWAPSAAAPGPAPAAGDSRPLRDAAIAIVQTDPDVVARYRAVADVPSEWFIDDDELQRWLRQDRRPDGLVRIAGRVTVASAAVDPFPAQP